MAAGQTATAPVRDDRHYRVAGVGVQGNPNVCVVDCVSKDDMVTRWSLFSIQGPGEASRGDDH